MLSPKNISEETPLLAALTTEEAAAINGGGLFHALGSAIGGVAGFAYGVVTLQNPFDAAADGADIGGGLGQKVDDAVGSIEWDPYPDPPVYY